MPMFISPSLTSWPSTAPLAHDALARRQAFQYPYQIRARCELLYYPASILTCWDSTR